MGFGLKRIFRRKKKTKQATPSTPTEAKKPPATPPTQLTKEETTAEEPDVPSTYSEDLPVKNLLEDLNIYAPTSGTGNTELIIGSIEDVPDDEPPLEPTHVPYNPDGLPPRDSNPAVDTSDETEELSGSESDEKKSADPSEDSPLAPRQLSHLDPSGKVAASESMIAVPNPKQENAPKVDDQHVDSTPDTKRYDEPEDVTRKLLRIFESATQCATGIGLPEPVQKLVPTADNALCHPIAGTKTRSDLSRNGPRLERQYSYFNEQFALKFLDELFNVGYALVNHQQLSMDADSEDEGDWVGRSVTLVIRPGICSAIQVEAPCLEWATLGGGQQTEIETTAVSLLDVHSIATSNAEDMVDDNDEEGKIDEGQNEDMQCFFTLTTKHGQVYVMEAITADESQRLVAGVKNLAARLSHQLIAGDPTVLSDFFDNSEEPDEIRFSAQEAMVRLPHILIDHLC